MSKQPYFSHYASPNIVIVPTVSCKKMKINKNPVIHEEPFIQEIPTTNNTQMPTFPIIPTVACEEKKLDNPLKDKTRNEDCFNKMVQMETPTDKNLNKNSSSKQNFRSFNKTNNSWASNYLMSIGEKYKKPIRLNLSAKNRKILSMQGDMLTNTCNINKNMDSDMAAESSTKGILKFQQNVDKVYDDNILTDSNKNFINTNNHNGVMSMDPKTLKSCKNSQNIFEKDKNIAELKRKHIKNKSTHTEYPSWENNESYSNVSPPAVYYNYNTFKPKTSESFSSTSSSAKNIHFEKYFGHYDMKRNRSNQSHDTSENKYKWYKGQKPSTKVNWEPHIDSDTSTENQSLNNNIKSSKELRRHNIKGSEDCHFKNIKSSKEKHDNYEYYKLQHFQQVTDLALQSTKNLESKKNISSKESHRHDKLIKERNFQNMKSSKDKYDIKYKSANDRKIKKKSSKESMKQNITKKSSKAIKDSITRNIETSKKLKTVKSPIKAPYSSCIKDKDAQGTLKKSPALKSVVQVKKQIQFDDSKANYDLRAKLCHRNVNNIFSKQRNKVVNTSSRKTIPNVLKEHNLEIAVKNNVEHKNFKSKEKEIVHRKKKAKNPTVINYKKIKLVINISQKQTSSSDTNDENADKESENESLDNADVSFLDDFNVDEIIETLNRCDNTSDSTKQSSEESNSNDNLDRNNLNENNIDNICLCRDELGKKFHQNLGENNVNKTVVSTEKEENNIKMLEVKRSFGQVTIEYDDSLKIKKERLVEPPNEMAQIIEFMATNQLEVLASEGLNEQPIIDLQLINKTSLPSDKNSNNVNKNYDTVSIDNIKAEKKTENNVLHVSCNAIKRDNLINIINNHDLVNSDRINKNDSVSTNNIMLEPNTETNLFGVTFQVSEKDKLMNINTSDLLNSNKNDNNLMLIDSIKVEKDTETNLFNGSPKVVENNKLINFMNNEDTPNTNKLKETKILNSELEQYLTNDDTCVVANAKTEPVQKCTNSIKPLLNAHKKVNREENEVSNVTVNLSENNSLEISLSDMLITSNPPCIVINSDELLEDENYTITNEGSDIENTTNSLTQAASNFEDTNDDGLTKLASSTYTKPVPQSTSVSTTKINPESQSFSITCKNTNFDSQITQCSSKKNNTAPQAVSGTNDTPEADVLVSKIESDILQGPDKIMACSLEKKMLDCLGDKYIIKSIIHNGKFSKIYRCNNSRGQDYALKVLKNYDPGYLKEAMLMNLQHDIPKENYNCIFIFNSFVNKGMRSFLTEYYPKTLRQILEVNKKPFHINKVQELSRQLVAAVTLLRHNDIVHSDITPNHILLNSTNNRLKLCGFDEAHYIYDVHVLPNIGTINYRAPEIILGYSAGFSIDIWSTALIMFEMATNTVLFPGTFNNEILYNQMCILGNMPVDMINQSLFKDNHFMGETFKRRLGFKGQNITLIPTFYRNYKLRNSIYKPYSKVWIDTRSKWQKAEESLKLEEFHSLLEQMLILHPGCRLPIEFVYSNPFIYNCNT